MHVTTSRLEAEGSSHTHPTTTEKRYLSENGWFSYNNGIKHSFYIGFFGQETQIWYFKMSGVVYLYGKMI